MKSTERYSADTQITDSIDSKISAAPRFYKLQCCLLFATYRPYDVNNYISNEHRYFSVQKVV
jgi:hypothetical protein